MSILERKDVCYSYSAEKPVLRGMNCSFECGTLYALVGKSGAGKYPHLFHAYSGVEIFGCAVRADPALACQHQRGGEFGVGVCCGRLARHRRRHALGDQAHLHGPG